ncbi:MAG: trypsin-like peptidase domain-containing protein [Planctomycetaceae bacterium]
MSSLTGVAVAMAASLGGGPDGVILEFSAAWCVPCREMAPVVSRLQEQGYPIRTVDFDRERDLAQRFQIESLPTFVLIVRGREQERFSGRLSETRLRQMAQRIPARGPKPTDINRQAAFSPDGLSARTAIDQELTANTRLATDDKIVIRANNTEPSGPGEVTKNPMEVCVRIRVRDTKGLDIGSGTVIHSEPGRTLILTCGHIFRHFDEKSQIEVDIFHDGRAVSHTGRLIRRDLDKDIGLISIQTLTPLRVARVAPASVHDGQHVFSVGCGGGEPPSRLQHRVTSTSRYQGGYIECTGTPIQGRSGGGLFTPDGQVTGVCVFANPGSRRGLYTGLQTIHSLLDRVGLSALYREESSVSPIHLVSAETQIEGPQFEETVNADTVNREVPLGQREAVAADSASATPVAVTRRSGSMQPKPDTSALPASRTPLSDSVLQVLRETRGSEVVCIVRPRGNPSGPSRIVIIHDASQQFVSELTGELHNQIQPASMEVHMQQPVDELAVPVPQEAAFFGRSALESANAGLPDRRPLPSVSFQRSTGSVESGFPRYRRSR